jgi:hypothetical protein
VDGGVGFINDVYGRQLMEALDQASDDDGHFTMDDNSGGDEVPVIDGKLRFLEEGFYQAPDDYVVKTVVASWTTCRDMISRDYLQIGSRRGIPI